MKKVPKYYMFAESLLCKHITLGQIKLLLVYFLFSYDTVGHVVYSKKKQNRYITFFKYTYFSFFLNLVFTLPTMQRS